MGLSFFRTQWSQLLWQSQSMRSVSARKNTWWEKVFAGPRTWQYHWFITDVHFWDNGRTWLQHLGRILCYHVAIIDSNGGKISLDAQNTHTQTCVGVLAHTRKYTHLVSTQTQMLLHTCTKYQLLHNTKQTVAEAGLRSLKITLPHYENTHNKSNMHSKSCLNITTVSKMHKLLSCALCSIVLINCWHSRYGIYNIRLKCNAWLWMTCASLYTLY